MGIPTLISTTTASGASSASITSGIDSTYDEYMFVITDFNPSSDAVHFMFQVNATDDPGGDYDQSPITSTAFSAEHKEDDSSTYFAYNTERDQAEGTGFQPITYATGNGADECAVSILHLFTPSNTTYVKHFYVTGSGHHQDDAAINHFFAGYINDTTAIDDIQFKSQSGTFDAVIQMYGIA